MLERVHKFPNKKIRDRALATLQHYSYFAHHENVLLGMLNDFDQEVQSFAVNKILKVREKANEEAVDKDTR